MIRFACNACGRPIAVVTDKIATTIPCPHCNHPQTVPSESPVVPPPTDLVAPPNPSNGIVLSRRQATALGGLVLASSLASFCLGWLFGRTPTPEYTVTADLKCTVDGKIGNSRRPATVVFLPLHNRPEEKVALPALQNISNNAELLRIVRAIGGGITSADKTGEFSIVLPSADEYFVLVLAERDNSITSTAPDTRTLAQLGRYFLHGDQILAQSAWSWTRKHIRDGTRVVIDL